MKKLLSLLALCVGTQRPSKAQTEPLRSFDQQRVDLTQRGMYVLGGWAVGNLVYSATQLGKSSGEAKAFHQMNIGWAAIDLVLAGASLLSNRKPLPARSADEVLKQQRKFEKIFLINTALDVVYVGGGVYLNQRGERQDKAQLRGFGKAVILQGAFLFLFDGVMYAAHRTHYRKNESLWKNLEPADEGVGVKVKF
ncbi:DUF6992 family protein [Siphonobacter curvatus]|uniref:Uncharacterized protein n=1 Tax=Siphonobacter curvatus TaxID=2094562 RepID=A0A2S7IRW4_9BACT|nr:hypothetical protein [Siphonobacter curvatus]PQA60378.1 hypothetical protein C5O19_12405 [Siphonobacter curvatus]